MNITPVEEILIKKIIKPSLKKSTCEFHHLLGSHCQAETLSFVELLKNIKKFYKDNGGFDWDKVILESAVVKQV